MPTTRSRRNANVRTSPPPTNREPVTPLASPPPANFKPITPPPPAKLGPMTPPSPTPPPLASPLTPALFSPAKRRLVTPPPPASPPVTPPTPASSRAADDVVALLHKVMEDADIVSPPYSPTPAAAERPPGFGTGTGGPLPPPPPPSTLPLGPYNPEPYHPHAKRQPVNTGLHYGGSGGSAFAGMHPTRAIRLASPGQLQGYNAVPPPPPGQSYVPVRYPGDQHYQGGAPPPPPPPLLTRPPVRHPRGADASSGRGGAPPPPPPPPPPPARRQGSGRRSPPRPRHRMTPPRIGADGTMPPDIIAQLLAFIPRAVWHRNDLHPPIRFNDMRNYLADFYCEHTSRRP